MPNAYKVALLAALAGALACYAYLRRASDDGDLPSVRGALGDVKSFTRMWR